MALRPRTAPAARGAARAGVLLLTAIALASAAERVRPVALHFDIEPHAMTDWRLNPHLQGSYIAQTAELIRRLNERWTENGRPMKFIWDMPNWYDAFEATIDGVTKPWAQWIIDAGFDQLNIMNFADVASGMYNKVAWEFEYCQSIGRDVSMTVETQDIGLDSATFYEEGKQQMQNVLVAVNTTLHANFPDVFQGMEIHDYINWLTLTDSPGVEYSAHRLPVSVYVWQWWFALPDYTAERAELWDFLAAQPYDISVITFEAQLLLSSRQADLQFFIDEAAAHGYQVALAIGAAVMAQTGYHDYVLSLMQMAANFYEYGPLADPLHPPEGARAPEAIPPPAEGYGGAEEDIPPPLGGTLYPPTTKPPTTPPPATTAPPPTTPVPTTLAPTPTDLTWPTEQGGMGPTHPAAGDPSGTGAVPTVPKTPPALQTSSSDRAAAGAAPLLVAIAVAVIVGFAMGV